VRPAEGRGLERVLGLFTEEERRYLVGVRRALHQYPELSWQEERSAALLEEALHWAGACEVRRIAGTGVVGRIAGAEELPYRVALRGDIDALPIQEANAIPFASQIPGVMHACGHDIHAAWAVGAALLLSRRPARCDTLVVLQPAEEVGSGARAILESGSLESVAAIFGGHVDRRFEVGEVVAQPGPMAAAADTFQVLLHGRGAHGARPHEGADPLVGAAALVQALQTIVSRRIDPALPAVVTVGTIHGGEAPNVIPEQVALSGTLRATLPEVRTFLHSEVRRLVEGVSATYGLQGTLAIESGPPPLVNDPVATQWARSAVQELLGEEALRPYGTVNLAGEDFACYLERIPGAFLRIGARQPDSQWWPAHSPRFLPAEESLFVGAAVLANCARRAAASLAASARNP
jgi:amidohydrolase